MSGQYSPAFEAACEVAKNYAIKSAEECEYQSPFNALLLVVGDKDFLLEHSMDITRRKKTQDQLDNFIGCRLYDEDISDLFDCMNPVVEHDGQKKRKHEDGGIILDKYGEVLRAGVKLIYPEYEKIKTPVLDAKIMEYKKGDNAGCRHSTAARMSMYQNVDGAVVLSESVGSLIPFVNGDIIDDSVWVPSRISDTAEVAVSSR